MIVIKMKTDNAAFEEKTGEVSRILREIADKLDQGGSLFQTLYDSNGNKVGFVTEE